MKFAIDEYATLDSPLHRWPPREKLLGLGGLILAFSMVKSLALLPLMVGTTAILFALSHLPLLFLWRRLKLPGMFLLAVALVLPFFPATSHVSDAQSLSSAQSLEVLMQLGPFAIYRSGVTALIIIATRFLCILTLGLLLFGTTPFLATVRALRSLGLPPILADMTLLTYRYLYEISDSFRTLRTATRLRGFRAHRPNRHQLKTLSALAGSLLVRSYEQSDRVYNAMRLRGYGQAVSPVLPTPPKPALRYRLALMATLLLSLGLVSAEWLI